MVNGSTTNSVLLEDFLILLWQQDKWPQGTSPGRWPEGAHLRGHQQVHEVPDAGDEHFQNNCGKKAVKGWRFHLPARRHPCPQYHEDTGLAPGEPHGGVGEGDLASQLPWLKPFGQFFFFVGRLWIKRQSKASQQNQWPDPEDQGGDGVPRKEHRGEDL
jgi:hypothetical protein